MTPLEPFPVYTPLGIAKCVGICDEQDDVEWVTFILATGEPWFWRNPHIRLRRNVTNGLLASSGFTGLNDPVLNQIKRYKASGFLPPEYDPATPQTWQV